MAIDIKNTSNLIKPEEMRLKIAIIGKTRLGKTTFISKAPNVGVCACETGHGRGLLSVVTNAPPFDYFEPKSLEDIDALASGHIFKDKDTIGVDSFSAIARTIIKDFAVRMPSGAKGSSPRRLAGIPELNDYNTMGEVSRRVLDALLNLPKHVVISFLERTEKDHDTGAAISCGPDVPGQMYLAAPSMFDVVLYLKARKAFRNPADPKSAYTQRYFITQPDGFHIGGDRNNIAGKPILPAELPFDLETGSGTFADILRRYNEAYAAVKA